MQVRVTGRHMDLTEGLRSYATEKVERLDRYYDRILSVDVVFDEDGGRQRVEIIAKGDHHTTFIAKHADSDLFASVDQAVKDLERQLTRHKEKFRNRKHSGGRLDKQLGGAASPEEQS